MDIWQVPDCSAAPILTSVASFSIILQTLHVPCLVHVLSGFTHTL
jgi:hypothetical protein